MTRADKPPFREQVRRNALALAVAVIYLLLLLPLVWPETGPNFGMLDLAQRAIGPLPGILGWSMLLIDLLSREMDARVFHNGGLWAWLPLGVGLLIVGVSGWLVQDLWRSRRRVLVILLLIAHHSCCGTMHWFWQMDDTAGNLYYVEAGTHRTCFVNEREGIRLSTYGPGDAKTTFIALSVDGGQHWQEQLRVHTWIGAPGCRSIDWQGAQITIYIDVDTTVVSPDGGHSWYLESSPPVQ